MLELPVAAGRSVYSGKSLIERLTGRFYTPDVLGRDLASRIVALILDPRSVLRSKAALRICDPFCGDGRLIAEVLQAAASVPALHSRHWAVTVRDIDSRAARAARSAIKAVAQRHSINVSIAASVGDSLRDIGPAGYDIVVTNPPWELVKPDTREMARLSAPEAMKLREWLRTRCDQLDARFPNAKADVAWAGWGTNLARCGWESALRSCDVGGILGIVLPASILADRASVTMRRYALNSSRLIDLATYPPEARLFAKVDQPVAVATFVAEPSPPGLSATLRLFDGDCKEAVIRPLRMTSRQMDDSEYALPVAFGAATSELLESFVEHPRFRDLEDDSPTGLWSGRELDETRLHEKLQSGKAWQFIKGRMVARHAIVESPSKSVRARYVASLRSPNYERVVWRDVTRSSQRRRMIGTVIPMGWVCGNSLHVAHFRNGDPQRLRALHGVLSSYAFEFQMRSRLATGHMSLGVVRQGHVPKFTNGTVSLISKRAEQALESRAVAAEAALEVQVARSYGLGRDVFAAILGQFKMDPAERERLLDSSLWRGKRR